MSLNIEKTKKLLHGKEPKSKDRVIINCDICGVELNRQYGSYKQIIKKHSIYRCKTCVHKDVNVRAKQSIAAQKLHNDPEYQAKMQEVYGSQEYKSTISKKMKQNWENDEYRQNIINKNKSNKDETSKRSKSLWQDKDYIAKLKKVQNSQDYQDKMRNIYDSKEYCVKMKNNNTKSRNNTKKACQTKEFKQKMSRIAKARWKDPEYREKAIIGNIRSHNSKEYKEKTSIILQNTPKVSSIQDLLYSILDDLGVRYYREYNDKSDDPQCTIGPYNFDCVIPRENNPNLLIECQGDYWHSKQKTIKLDKSKSSYIKNNFPSQYELKYLWEHEFQCKDRIVETLKYWLNMSKFELIEYNFNDLAIKKSPASDYNDLLRKYHYLSNAGRGGISYGAYLGDILIAVVIFSPLIRQNIKIESFNKNEVRELSRFCVHPKYQKENLASWFISRSIKMLSSKYKCIISYCDTTFNHDGALYKACNFELDKTISPDYWYVDTNGWAMHKKTLYNKSKKFGLTESEYALRFGYKKVYGKEKLRFIYRR